MTPEEIESARTSLGLSIRAAAKLAGISEGRWRQIIAGSMRVGGVEVPVNPKASTLVAMERAVSAQPQTAGPSIRQFSDVELVQEVGRRLAERSETRAREREKSSRGTEAARHEEVDEEVEEFTPQPATQLRGPGASPQQQ